MGESWFKIEIDQIGKKGLGRGLFFFWKNIVFLVNYLRKNHKIIFLLKTLNFKPVIQI
jgi:hypothetical protein